MLMSDTEPAPPAEEAPIAPPAATPASGGPARAGAPVRLVAVILAFILAFVAAVAVVTMLDVGDLTPCEDLTSPAQLVDGECFDGSAAAKTRTQIFGWIGSGLAILSIVAALVLALSGRGRRTFALLTAATMLMFVLSLVL